MWNGPRWPLRGHARSHRVSAIAVGAGLPAKRPQVFIFMATFPGTAVHEKDDKFFVTDWRNCRV
ncbi:protein of unknown function [Pseudomonas inefficax]|uniref:Uncharacterized protein n=1 Tax=Pseudomonas inefficax TaxID=2078786 RepID=A0AAQ1SSF7_9PSED|nr:protein of unknown function [Pseudomonas inefficax]